MRKRTEVVVRAVRSKRDGVWDLFIDVCPYCGGKHHHGGGDGKKPVLGYRAPHCVGRRPVVDDYYLVLKEGRQC